MPAAKADHRGVIAQKGTNEPNEAPEAHEDGGDGCEGGFHVVRLPLQGGRCRRPVPKLHECLTGREGLGRRVSCLFTLDQVTCGAGGPEVLAALFDRRNASGANVCVVSCRGWRDVAVVRKFPGGQVFFANGCQRGEDGFLAFGLGLFRRVLAWAC